MSIAIWKIWIKSFDKKILKVYFVHLFSIAPGASYFWISFYWLSPDKFNNYISLYYNTNERLLY